MGVNDMKKLFQRVTRVDTSSPLFGQWWSGCSNLGTFAKYRPPGSVMHWKFDDMKKWWDDILTSKVHLGMFRFKDFQDSLF